MIERSTCALLRDFLLQTAADSEFASLYLTKLPARSETSTPTADERPAPSARSLPTARRAAAVDAHPSEYAPTTPAAAPTPALLRDADTLDCSAYGFTPPAGDNAARLAALQSFIGACARCPILARNRTNIVFGVGNPHAAIMFVGEAPGRDEDAQGIPFVGRAGQLLTNIIEKGMGLRREEVYIANILKCRPPNNREPQPDEVSNCTPFLNVQIGVIQPRVIVALGTYAARFLTGSNAPISKLRGEFQQYRGVPVLPTFHPAYLLRNYTPELRRHVWDDVRKVLAFIER
jgi:DNA polymerase